MRRSSRATAAAAAPVGSPTSVAGIGANVAGSENKTANAFGAMNVIKHAERCPKSTLDKTTTTFTIFSMASSVCDQIGMGLGWGLSAIGCGGIAFMATTASINKQFDLVSMKQDLASMKMDLGNMKTQMVSLEMELGFAKLSVQIAQNTPHGNRLQDFDGEINALRGKINELQDIETGKINILQGEINVLKSNIEAKKAAIAALEFKSTPLVSVHEHV